ncbi:MAG: SGNH/GDSL hydrolase family protein [Polyangiales bacterium]
MDHTDIVLRARAGRTLTLFRSYLVSLCLATIALTGCGDDGTARALADMDVNVDDEAVGELSPDRLTAEDVRDEAPVAIAHDLRARDTAAVEVGATAQASSHAAQAPDGAGAGAGSPVIVVLGSSTSAGIGASRSENQWVERYRAYLRQNFPNFQLINLAQGGATTYEIQPSDYNPPANRPRPNTGRNISYALSLNPGAIIINMPSNDQQGRFSVDEQMANYNRVAGLAAAQGVQVWVSTSQPRNFPDQNQRNDLMKARDAIRGRFGDHTLDFWNGIANWDGTINGTYDSGDGVHLNDNGHKVLSDRAQWARIPYAVRGW